MIARFSADRQHAQLISVPRDSWVDIPGHGMDKVNAAYAYGGPTLLIPTIEQPTDVRIDHYVAIHFEGPIQVTDDLGGDRKSTRLNSRHGNISYAASCLAKTTSRA